MECKKFTLTKYIIKLENVVNVECKIKPQDKFLQVCKIFEIPDTYSHTHTHNVIYKGIERIS